MVSSGKQYYTLMVDFTVSLVVTKSPVWSLPLPCPLPNWTYRLGALSRSVAASARENASRSKGWRLWINHCAYCIDYQWCSCLFKIIISIFISIIIVYQYLPSFITTYLSILVTSILVSHLHRLILLFFLHRHQELFTIFTLFISLVSSQPHSLPWGSLLTKLWKTHGFPFGKWSTKK